jgi:hypothetical protein
MNLHDITISNVHERGFAFGITDGGQQVFIPPHAAKGHDLDAGVRMTALVSINPSEQQREQTPFLAILLKTKGEEKPEKPTSVASLDEKTLVAIKEAFYVTTAQIAEALDIDTRAAGNSANRLFNAGKIAKADVYGRVGQSRPSFILWAEDASDFMEEQ